MLSIGHWNLNSLVVHNFTKVALLKAYSSVQRFDMFCNLKLTSTLVLQSMMIIRECLDMI